MMNDAKKMQQARWELEMLTASDPSATSNMMRHVAALSLMLTCRRQTDSKWGEPEISACFLMDAEDRRFRMYVAARTGIDQIHVGFDVDDAVGPACGIAIIRVEGDVVASYGECRLWSPANDGRAVLVPMGEGGSGHFAFQKEGPLRKLPGRPARDLAPGFRRAATRYARLVTSADLRDVGREGFLHVISDDRGTLSTRPTSLAA